MRFCPGETVLHTSKVKGETKKKHCSRESYAGTFNPDSNGTNKCKSKIHCSVDSNHGFHDQLVHWMESEIFAAACSSLNNNHPKCKIRHERDGG